MNSRCWRALIQATRHTPREKSKVADRPHVVTIALGVGSAFISLLSIILAYQALTMNTKGLKVGQRAYVIALPGEYGDMSTPHLVPQGHVLGMITGRLRLKNLGNTPATDV